MSHETVYAIASGKGGVGKTTATVNLGTALAQAGERVAIVDVDLGMANLAGFVSLTPDSTTLHDVLAGAASVEDATYQLPGNIVAIPSGADLEDYAKTSPERLREVVETLRGEFDTVLLDVGAGVSHETVLPLGLADAVVLVSTPEPAAVYDTQKTIELSDRAGGRVEGLILNCVRDGEDVSYEEIADQLGTELLATIPEDPTVRESVFAGTPLVVHDPHCPASKAYRQLAVEFTDLEVPAAEAEPESDDDEPDGGDDDGDATEADASVASHDDVSSAITEAESNPK